MEKNSYGGFFVAIDGPNGVGKSTIIQLLNNMFCINNIDAYITKEPTGSKLGNFIRKAEETYRGESLACMVAADRYNHLNREILPYLKQDKLVLSDRYVMSSFVLQGIDNVDFNFIKNVNEKAILPDLQIVITGSRQDIRNRLLKRDILTRFEKSNLIDEEIKLFKNIANKMKKMGVEVFEVNNSKYVERSVNLIYNKIMEFIA